MKEGEGGCRQKERGFLSYPTDYVLMVGEMSFAVLAAVDTVTI